MSEQNQRRGIYLLPNLFTSASLFSAYYSIVASMNHQYEIAVIAIFICMIADTLDGRVARLTNTQSEFGAEFDSLSDMVAFGVAPSLIAYSWALHSLGKIGWLICFSYTASVSLRLARFNVQHDSGDGKYFVGLPCPPGAGIVCGFIWFLTSWNIMGDEYAVAITLGVIMFLTAALMVSNIAFYSFKDIDFKGKVPFLAIVIMCLVFIAIALYPAMVLCVSFIAYGLSGLIFAFRKNKQLTNGSE